MLKYYINSPSGRYSEPKTTPRATGSRTLALSSITFWSDMPVTILALTISQVRAIVITCVATFLVLYTFSDIFHLIQHRAHRMRNTLPPRFVFTFLPTNPFFHRFQPLGKFPCLISLLSPALELSIVAEAVPLPIAVAHMLCWTIHRSIRLLLQGRESENEVPNILHHSPRALIAEWCVYDPFPPRDVLLLGMQGYS